MASIHLLTVHPESDLRARGGFNSLHDSAQLDRYHVHRLTDDPSEAEIILFAEIDTGRLCESVLAHPYIRRFRSKCFMFSSDWRVIPFLPGVYTGVEKSWYLPGRSRPGFYPDCLINPLIKFEPDGTRDLLYSFMGDLKTAPVRRVLAELHHPRGLFVDTSHESQAVMWEGTPEHRAQFWQRYVDAARRSSFILCPRGMAPSSIRLFEAMKMGRVPVILADEWLPPDGPRWEEFSLRIPERDAAAVPRLLEEKEGKAGEMGHIARGEWEKYFSQEVMFHRVVELCLEIQRGRRRPDVLDRLTLIPQLLRERNLREYVRAWRQRGTRG
jgi:hypothetical protein